MNKLGDLLRTYISNSGHSIYKAAHKANINRTTLQKILAGERQASESVLNKLIPILKLSPDEEANIWQLYEIVQIGEATYQQRQYVKHLVQSVADLDCSFHDQQNEYRFDIPPDIRAHNIDQMSPTPVKGTLNINHLLSHLFLMEYGKANQIYINAPAHLPAIKQLFINNLPNCKDRIRINVKHITPFLKPRAETILPLMNLEVLSGILPFAISQAFHYEVFCFYTRELLRDNLHSAFPYYIIFSNAAVLLSVDGQTALPLTEPATIDYFQDMFFDALKKSSSMLYSNTSPGEILDDLIRTDRDARPFWTLEYQPCLTSYLKPDMIEKYARPDIPNRELVMGAAVARIRQLAAMEQRSCIFSKAGLMEFAVDGTISDLPSCYVHPLAIADRIRLLKSLYIACKQDKSFLRMVNPVTFTIPKHLCFAIRKGHSIDFNGYDPHDINMNYIHITEPGILDAFEDFYESLKTSNLIYSKEETLIEIENILIGLSTKLYLSYRYKS